MGVEASPKILVIGDVRGNFNQAFRKVNFAFSKHNNLDVFFLGHFLPETVTAEIIQDLEEQSKKLSCPVNIVLCSDEYSALDKRGQIGDLIFFLTGLNSVRTTSDINVVYWSEYLPDESKEVSDELNNSINGLMAAQCDILLTNSSPLNVYNLCVEPEGAIRGNYFIARLAKFLKPRYHFAPNPDVFYQRQPYRNHNVLSQRDAYQTRFVSIAGVDNPGKQKWAFFFGFDAKGDNSSTDCPYPAEMFAQRENVTRKREIDSIRFSTDTSQDSNSQERKKPRQSLEENCWFCLKSPKFEKHLVIYINDNDTFYLALAKGGVVEDNILIVTVEHHECGARFSPELQQDFLQLQEKVTNYFKYIGKSVVYFERNYNQFHFIMQVVPVNPNVERNLIPTFFKHLDSMQTRLSADRLKNGHTLWKVMKSQHHSYLYIEFPTGEKFLVPLRTSQFPINFGRELLCDPAVLNLPENVEWRTCIRSEEEERAARDEIKQQFMAFIS